MMEESTFLLTVRMVAALCCVYPALSDIKQFIWIQNHAYNDVDVFGNVISFMSEVETALDCSRECRQNPDCLSFSCNADLTCRLHSVRLAYNVSALPSPGSRHYYRFAGDCPIKDGYELFQDLNLCIKVNLPHQTWHQSRDLCNQSGSRLIVLDTEEKHTAVREYIDSNFDESRYWIGMTDEINEGVFVWENGNNVSFSTWKLGNPNNV
ncbi:macrophage mannose receptor 1-like [Gigantopelta aegis]|uniref:macrophage mannose receptor 1-like n=1 Tax=Gigantopelta aegis TaxID=1735272 RepID=UPI001B88C3D6|nr:macrophage mannose receptor 1-like [Gigantopelta aegis]